MAELGDREQAVARQVWGEQLSRECVARKLAVGELVVRRGPVHEREWVRYWEGLEKRKTRSGYSSS